MNHSELFTAIDSLLFKTREYWQCVAFAQREFPWPNIAKPLFSLSDEEVNQLDGDHLALQGYLLKLIQ